MMPLRRSHAIIFSLEPANTPTNVAPTPPEVTPPASPALIPLEPVSTSASLPPPPAQATSSTAPRVPATLPPLRRSHSTIISLEPVSTNPAFPPSPPQASSSSPPIVRAADPMPTASTSTSTAIAELPFPLPEPDILQACNYTCGPKLCAWCAKDRPIGHSVPIPDFVISTIIRHSMPHKFESLERIEDGAVAEGACDNVEPGGNFQPPAWGSEKARPKKSSIRKCAASRFAPYPDPSTRHALVRRSSEDIKASLDEAFANRMQLNYEGPVAIAIRDEISALNIPGEEPFKWQPEYTGPASENFSDSAEPSATELPSAMKEDLEEEAALVEIVLPPGSKKRRYQEDDDDDVTTDAPPSKKLRTARRLPGSKLAAFSIPSFRFPSFSLTVHIPSFSTTLSFPSPIRSTSPSTTSTGIATGPASDGSDLDSGPSPRRLRVAKKKLRFQLFDPSSNHPKFGKGDSIYWHHRRLTSTSKNGRDQKKQQQYVPQGETWSPDEIEFALMGQEDWEKGRKSSLLRKTSRKSLLKRVETSEALDASAERFQKLVDRYERDCSAIDLAGVRARYIRPRQNEVPSERNKEAMPVLGPLDEMRDHYPAWDHPAWNDVAGGAVGEWMTSPHYRVKVHEVLKEVEKEEKKKKKRANAEPDAATEIASVEDEDEEQMRREFIEAEVGEVEAPRRSGSESVFGAPPSGEGKGGLDRQMAMSAVDFESQWSAPSAPHPTGFDDGWSTSGAGPSTWASGF